jgi:methyl-accepting chemotaxis protein
MRISCAQHGGWFYMAIFSHGAGFIRRVGGLFSGRLSGSLSSRIVLTAVGIVAIAISAAIFAASMYNSSRTQDDFETKLYSLGAMVANVAPPLILSRDTTTLSYVLESLQEDPDFNAAFVADDIVALASSGRDNNARLAVSPRTMTAMLGKEVWDVAADKKLTTIRQGSKILQIHRVEIGHSKKMVGYAVLSFDNSRQMQRIATENQITIAAGAAILFLLGGMLWLLLSRTLRPLKAMTVSIVDVSRGQLDGEVAGVTRKDEIGEIARALGVLKSGLSERAALEQRERDAELSQQSRRTEIDTVIAGFRADVRDVLDAFDSNASQMTAASDILASTAAESSTRGSRAATTSAQASASVENAAQAAEEMGAAIQEVEQQIDRVREEITEAAEASRLTAASVRELDATARTIGEVVNLIRDIAAQTNLLALNATIEAARAGDAGRGFAVVAAEVKTLSAQTAAATDRIVGQVNAIQSATGSVVSDVENIASRMGKIEDFANAVAASVVQQSVATGEIASGVAHASTAALSVSSDLTVLAESVEETGRSADEMRRSARDVAKEAGRLRESVDRFLERVAV